MNRAALAALLEAVRSGDIAPAEALAKLGGFPSEDLGFARLDHQRQVRQGRPEVIYAAGKTAEQVVAIAERLIAAGAGVLATRTDGEQRTLLKRRFEDARIDPIACTVTVPPAAGLPIQVDDSRVLVVSAGTSDLPVAAEAAATLLAFGRGTRQLHDVGVAGLHRLLGEEEELRNAQVIIVVAGMDGALPSVVGGLVAVPVIAVPTSVGYGASFGGLAALLTMLNSCSSGVTVTNIDNGFGAAVAADRILAGYPPGGTPR